MQNPTIHLHNFKIEKIPPPKKKKQKKKNKKKKTKNTHQKNT